MPCEPGKRASTFGNSWRPIPISPTISAPGRIIEKAFDLKRQLRNIDGIFAQVFKAKSSGKSGLLAGKEPASVKKRSKAPQTIAGILIIPVYAYLHRRVYEFPECLPPVRIALLALLLDCSAIAGSPPQTTDSGKEQTGPPAAPQKTPASRKMQSLQYPTWRKNHGSFFKTGLHSKRAPQREEAVKALSLLEGNSSGDKVLTARPARQKPACARGTLLRLWETSMPPLPCQRCGLRSPTRMLRSCWRRRMRSLF